jgi:hypothetical protein
MSRLDPQLLAAFDSLDDQAFLGKAYITFLGRPVDPSGFRDYLGRLKAGVSRMQICEELIGSDEGRRHASSRLGQAPARAGAGARSVAELMTYDGIEFVEHAYRAILGREVDPTGLKHYSGRLAAGESKLQIVADLRSDPEGQAYGSRLEGLSDAVSAIRRGDENAFSAVSSLMALSDEAFLVGAYRLILGREADPEGKTVYSKLLRTGLSRLYIVKELATSEEGAGKAARLKGVQRAIRAYDSADSQTCKGWYLRNVKGVESDFPAERQMRAIAYSLRALLGSEEKA